MDSLRQRFPRFVGLFRRRRQEAEMGEEMRPWSKQSLVAVLGRGFRSGDVTRSVVSVVGVVGDVRAGAVELEPPPQVYRPHHQRNDSRMTLVLRTVTEPAFLSVEQGSVPVVYQSRNHRQECRCHG